MRNSWWICLLLLSVSCGQNNTEKKETNSASHENHGNATGGSASYVKKINSGELTQDTLKGSPKMIAMANVGNVHVHITYSSPGVKDRVIWGGLVPYNKVWVTGAHSATTVNINEEIIVGGEKIPAGTFSLFTIPGKEKWTIILNKNYAQHLTDEYDQAQDLVRVEVVPQVVAFTPRLIYSISETNSNNGLISVQWEKIKIDLPFSVTTSTH